MQLFSNAYQVESLPYSFAKAHRALIPKSDDVDKLQHITGYTDVLESRKTGVDEYLDILSGYDMENAIMDYTREETLGYRIIRTCINHILVTLKLYR